MRNRINLSSYIGICIIAFATDAFALPHYTDFSGRTNWNEGSDTHYGSSFITTFNGHTDLQLVSDYQTGITGTWKSEDFSGKNIVAFNASFKFSFKNEGGPGDGFSFLFGDMTDMSNERWHGGEYGLKAFQELGSGMSIGFDSYGNDCGIYARWGDMNVTWVNFGTEWYNLATYTDYNQALDDYYQGTIYVNWNKNSGLNVGVSWPGYDTWWGINTDMFTGDIMDTTDFSFGFVARNGGIDNDVLIDNFLVEYTYYMDCNVNDIDDADDIANGDSIDLNGDGIPDECQCIADINGDGFVKVQDLLTLIKHWGSEDPNADINADGVVNVSDVLILIENWGPCE